VWGVVEVAAWVVWEQQYTVWGVGEVAAWVVWEQLQDVCTGCMVSPAAVVARIQPHSFCCAWVGDCLKGHALSMAAAGAGA
jgi:hypothetical protein